MHKVPGIVLPERGQLPVLTDVEVHPPGPNEVMIRMVASGICHTDVSYMRDARACPVILGHEGAGVVEQVGDQVSHVTPGDHVVVNWQAKCFACHHCLSGRPDLCENIQGTAAPRVFWRGEPLNVMLNAGTFSPYAVVPAGGAVKVRKDIPLDKAALLGCAVATGVGAALYTAAVQPGDSVAVIGTGGVGLNIVQGARLAGATQIIALDINEANLTLARDFGATDTVNSQREESVAAVRGLTGGRGVGHVFEVVGLSELMLQGIDMLARGGALTLVGAAARDATLPFFPRKFMSQQQRILGCIYGNISPSLDLPMFADLYMTGRLKLDELHTASVRLEDVVDVFAGNGPQGGIRSVIQFE
jgi:S-(hydroxymethyl)glutathione dehydrogenase / alcohol dehydrogenase